MVEVVDCFKDIGEVCNWTWMGGPSSSIKGPSQSSEPCLSINSLIFKAVAPRSMDRSMPSRSSLREVG